MCLYIGLLVFFHFKNFECVLHSICVHVFAKKKIQYVNIILYKNSSYQLQCRDFYDTTNVHVNIKPYNALATQDT